ncbi:MAG: matrixin family metalloprotease [Planctomycetota bacterium]|nr:matrixin family metalloprotease [Planctomycetota bacterium]
MSKAKKRGAFGSVTTLGLMASAGVAGCVLAWGLQQRVESPIRAAVVSEPESGLAPGEGTPYANFPEGIRVNRELGRIAACFDPANPPPPEVVAALNTALQFGAPEDPENPFADRYPIGSYWGGVGSPRNLTWSFVPDGLSISNGIGEGVANSNLFSSMDSKFGGVANRQTWITQFVNSFARWQALSGIRYTRVRFNNNEWDDGAAWGTGGAANARGDVRICSKPIDGVNGVLAYNFFPTTSDMVLDSAEGWGNSASTYRFLRNTIMHEHGHGLGFPHVCSNNAGFLMEPFLSTSFDGPQQDDLRHVHRGYGDFYEANDTPATATVIPTAVTPSSNFTFGSVPTPAISNGWNLSIDANGDLDCFRITVSANGLYAFVASPIGTTYDDNGQLDDGSCPSGFSTNALAQADLVVAVTNTAGSATLFSNNIAGLGAAESVTQVLLPAGDWIVRVSENGSPTQSQLYSLRLQGLGATSVTATNNVVSQVNLTWTNIPNSTAFTIFRSTTNNRASAVSVGTAGALATSFSDTTAPTGVPLFYWVDATQGGGPQRNVGTATGQAVPPAPPCPADFDNSGFLDSDDFILYVSQFALGCDGPGSPDPACTQSADFDGSTFVDSDDFISFVTAFEAGCNP